MKNIKNVKMNPFVYYLVAILYLEFIMKVVVAGHLVNIGLLYLVVFTLPIVLLLTILTKAFKKGINKFILIVSTLIITIYIL